MRSDLLKNILKAYVDKDDKKFIETANMIIKNEEGKKHTLLAADLKKILSGVNKNHNNLSINSHRYKPGIPIPRDTEKGFPLLEIQENYFNLKDVVLKEITKDRIEIIIQEYQSQEQLRAHSLRPKNRILFCGPPGTGKTLTAKILSSELNIPLVYVRFDAIISSFLGETAKNLRRIFNFIENGEWVVLFDEFDIIGKQRDDPYEHGEIKRVVNNFMQILDSFQGKSLILAATNHQHLLDPAIWRRFDDIIYFDIPDEKRRYDIFNMYLRVMKKSKSLNIKNYISKTEGFAPSDIAQICEEALRRIILHNKSTILPEDIEWAIEQQKRKRNIVRDIQKWPRNINT